MRLLRDVRRGASPCPTRPVTPEVAGSSPVAPAEVFPCKPAGCVVSVDAFARSLWPVRGPLLFRKVPASGDLLAQLVAGRTNKPGHTRIFPKQDWRLEMGLRDCQA